MLPFPLAGRYNTPIGQSKAKIKKERKISMKRLVAIILALLLLLVQPLALADGTPVSELWERAKATPIEASLAEKQSTLLLQHAMDGMFLNENFDDQFNVLMLAQSLPMLSAIPSADIDAFATAYDLPLRAVEHNYYLSLANALKAEIAMNPSSEEEYRNIQALLELFLTDDDAIIDGVNVGSQQDAARRSITTDQLESIATQYRLPVEFVKGIVLNDDWDDDDWDDDDWDDDRYDDDWDDRYDDYDDYYDDDRTAMMTTTTIMTMTATTITTTIMTTIATMTIGTIVTTMTATTMIGMTTMTTTGMTATMMIGMTTTTMMTGTTMTGMIKT